MLRTTALTITAALFSAGLLMAAPARAATSATVDCNTSSGENLTIPANETLVINTTNCTSFLLTGLSARPISFGPGGTGGTGSPGATGSLTSGDQLILSGWVPAPGLSGILLYGGPGTVTVLVTILPAQSSAPAPLIQQFGKPATGTCDAAAPESLNWSGVASGGWGASWAHWMNGGNGGAVCTRTLVYSTAQSRWVVG